MFPFLNPWVILAFLMALAGVYEYGHHEGYKEKEQEDAIVIVKKNEEMQNAKQQADTQLAQAKKSLATKNSQLIDAIHTGEQRLFVNVTPQAGCASPSDTETRAELDRSVSEALVTITGDGDQAIVELNSCIDSYEAMRKIISKVK